jgi:hypothetical protein
MVVKQAAKKLLVEEELDYSAEVGALNPPSESDDTVGHDVATTDTIGTQDPQIVILGVAGSSPVSHPTSSPIGSFSACVADVRRGESNADYHGDRVYRNCSSAKTALDSIPLYHARHVACSLPPFSSDAVEHGSLLHEWFEKGDPVLETWAVPPEETLTSTGQVGKDAKRWAEKEFGTDAAIVSPKLFAQIKAEIKAIKNKPPAMSLIERIVERELSARWTSPEGDRLRCRFDALTSDGTVVDLKTTREADILRDFWKSVLDFKYHFQCAWYMHGMEACGMEPKPLQFIVLSTSLPHDCQVVTLPAALIAEGQRLMDKVLAELRLRESLDWWLPDTHGEVVELQFPASVLGRLS